MRGYILKVPYPTDVYCTGCICVLCKVENIKLRLKSLSAFSTVIYQLKGEKCYYKTFKNLHSLIYSLFTHLI